MRKFILISVLVLASAAAQAGQTRGLTLASNDEPGSAEKIESVKPEAPKADVKSEASQPAKEASRPAKQASRPNRVHARRYADDEAMARSIAARYGVSW